VNRSRDSLKYGRALPRIVTDGDPWRERYSRHLVLSPLGEGGQRTLGRSTVAVVGAGGLGSNSAEMLVRIGFGRVRVIDGDAVELSNLPRVRLYGDDDVGRLKVQVLAERLAGMLPGAVIEPVVDTLGPGNALELIEGADVVLDGLDNMDGRYILNDACLEMGVPWVYGGVVATGGLVAPFPAGGPCLRCLFPEPPAEGALRTTAEVGIHPSLPAAVASIQVAHATRIVLGQAGDPVLLAMDLWSDEWRTVPISRREDCAACGRGRREFLRGA
jgi:molybdopterin/thiamine biosynthesis adenylyltransferase